MAATALDVLCVGHASYDLVFEVAAHPKADEKTVADSLLACGGGPAANAAVQAARLGCLSGFCGYLGADLYGDAHLQELIKAGVNVELVVRGSMPTPLSAIIVKPDGARSLINYKGETKALFAEALDLSAARAKVFLFDGHEPYLSRRLLELDVGRTPSVLDGGSWHPGTEQLLPLVDYPVCSEKFAAQFAGGPEAALARLAENHPAALVTLGERGLIWRRGAEQGRLPAPPGIAAVDSTGAGDAFHGAFAAGLAAGLPWLALLRFASAAGALCCTRLGARPGLPFTAEVEALLAAWPAV